MPGQSQRKEGELPKNSRRKFPKSPSLLSVHKKLKGKSREWLIKSLVIGEKGIKGEVKYTPGWREFVPFSSRRKAVTAELPLNLDELQKIAEKLVGESLIPVIDKEGNLRFRVKKFEDYEKEMEEELDQLSLIGKEEEENVLKGVMNLFRSIALKLALAGAILFSPVSFTLNQLKQGKPIAVEVSKAYGEESKKVVVWKWDEIKKDFEESREISGEELKEKIEIIPLEESIELAKSREWDGVFFLNMKIEGVEYRGAVWNWGGVMKYVKLKNLGFSGEGEIRFELWDNGVYNIKLVTKDKDLWISSGAYMDENEEVYKEMEEKIKEVVEKYNGKMIVRMGNLGLRALILIPWDGDIEKFARKYALLTEEIKKIKVDALFNPPGEGGTMRAKVKVREVKGEDGKDYKVLTVGELARAPPDGVYRIYPGRYEIGVYTEGEDGNGWAEKVKVYLDKGEEVVDYGILGVVDARRKTENGIKKEKATVISTIVKKGEEYYLRVNFVFRDGAITYLNYKLEGFGPAVAVSLKGE